MDAEVIDVGFISDAQEGAVAAEQLRQADCDLIVLFLTTYLTSSMVLPIAQRANTPGAGDRPAADREDGPRHRSTPARGWRTAGSARCPRSATCSGGPGIPFRSRLGLAAPGVGVAAHRALDQRGARARGAAPRPARPHGPRLPGHARRLDRPHAAARHVRLARGGARVRRPAGAGRAGHRRRDERADGPRPRDLHARRHRQRRGLRLGRPRLGRDWIASSRTSTSTRSPTTTAASTASSTNAWAPGMILGASLLTARGIPDDGRVRAAHHGRTARDAGRRRRRVVLRDPGAQLRRRRGRDGPRRPGAPRGVGPRPAAARARRLPRQARLGRLGRVRRAVRPGHAARARAGPRRRPRLRRVRGHRGARAAAGDRQHDQSGSTSAATPASGSTSGRATGIGHHWSLSVGHRAGDYRAAASLLGIDYREV